MFASGQTMPGLAVLPLDCSNKSLGAAMWDIVTTSTECFECLHSKIAFLREKRGISVNQRPLKSISRLEQADPAGSSALS